jgi:hypothetical protein
MRTIFLRFEVLTAVKMTMLFFCVLTPCRFVHGIETQKNNIVRTIFGSETDEASNRTTRKTHNEEHHTLYA